MPIYEYQCGKCGHRLEALQKLSEAPLKKCPECGRPALERLISPSAFHLKGTGWYVTDFRDKHKKAGANGEGKGAGGEKDASKPAAKKDAGKDGKASGGKEGTGSKTPTAASSD